jgi:metal-responsive CopG/Arc/MetJ family transcriptional regulator
VKKETLDEIDRIRRKEYDHPISRSEWLRRAINAELESYSRVKTDNEDTTIIAESSEVTKRFEPRRISFGR